MHPRYPLYVVPRPGQRFVVGATELESEDRGPATLRSVLELGSALYSLHPALAEARVLHTATALRPALNDHLPHAAPARGRVATQRPVPPRLPVRAGAGRFTGSHLVPMNTLSLNGDPLHSDAAATLAEPCCCERGYDLGAAFACALNHVFVPRHHWPQQPLRDGDRIDVITPVTGG